MYDIFQTHGTSWRPEDEPKIKSSDSTILYAGTGNFDNVIINQEDLRISSSRDDPMELYTLLQSQPRSYLLAAAGPHFPPTPSPTSRLPTRLRASINSPMLYIF